MCVQNRGSPLSCQTLCTVANECTFQSGDDCDVVRTPGGLGGNSGMQNLVDGCGDGGNHCRGVVE